MTASMWIGEPVVKDDSPSRYYVSFDDHGQPAVETFSDLDQLRAFRAALSGDYSVGSL